VTDNRIILPDGWKRPRGWSIGIRVGDELNVAGQFGWDPATHSFESSDFAAQWHQAMQNVLTVVSGAGGAVTDVVALRVYVTDLALYREAGAGIAELWGSTFGRHFPAITLVGVSGLTEADALVEVEAVARFAERPQ
jgi:enamine deaminase RidA (YjgF/YER057c/UK114 family)